MSRRRRGGRKLQIVVVVGLVVVLLSQAAFSAGSFTSASVEREASVSVVDDGAATFQLEVGGEQGCFFIFCRGDVVTVTNNYDHEITVTIRMDEETTFSRERTLAPGASTTYSKGALGGVPDTPFDLRMTGSGISATVRDRVATF